MSTRLCQICYHYNALVTDAGMGECRRHAPSLSLGRTHNENTRNKIRGQWAIVSHCDWCGEFFPRFDAPVEMIEWYMTNGHLF